MTVQIRLAAETDVPVCADLLFDLFTQDREFVPDRDLQVRGLTRILQNPSAGTVFVAETDGVVVGMVSLLATISSALGGPVGTLEDLVVSRSCRGQGIGKSLVQAVLDHARVSGYLRVTLLTDCDNTKAQGLYTAFGFSRSTMVPLRKLLVGIPPGSALPWVHDPMEPR